VSAAGPETSDIDPVTVEEALGPERPGALPLADPDDPPYETRPRASRGDDVPLLSNAELARIFYEIGDMMELKGELRFKADAYRRAAESVGHSSGDVARAYRAGRPPRLVGVGKAIDEKLAELADTGRLRYYERLRREVPPSLVALLGIPGLGPRTIKQVFDELGVVDLASLEAAATSGRLRQLKGMSAKTEERILKGLEVLESQVVRMRLGQAQEIVDRVAGFLAASPSVTSVTPTGSYRRRRETIGDLDILFSSNDAVPVLNHFVALPDVWSAVGDLATRIYNGGR